MKFIKVRCTDNSGIAASNVLTQGNVYSVNETHKYSKENGRFYEVYDESGNEFLGTWFKNRFELITPIAPIAHQAIQTKFLPFTSTKPSRIKAFTHTGNQLIISTSHLTGTDQENHTFVAKKLAEKLNWPNNWVCGTTKDGYVFVQHQQ